MGCDIHLYREVRNKTGQWVALGSFARVYFEGDELRTPKAPHISRNYDLFGVLSKGVRVEFNHSLTEDRGIPEDVCPEIAEINENWGGDVHSHGHATLKEIREFWKEYGSDLRYPKVGQYLSCETTGYTEENSERLTGDDDLSFFLVEWVDDNLAPFAWGGDESVRLVFWFDD